MQSHRLHLPKSARFRLCCSIKVSVWGFTVLSPYNYISKGEDNPLGPNVCGAKPQGGVKASGCSITSVPISLGRRAGLLPPCQAPQHVIHLIPGKKSFQTDGFCYTESDLVGFPMRDSTAIQRSLVYMEVKQNWGEKKNGKVSDLLGSPLPLKEIN